MKALLGRKIGMSQVFSPDGEVVPVTLISALPNTVTIRRTVEKDGYAAVQLALPKKEGAKLGEKRTPNAYKEVFAARREFAGEIAADVESLSVEQFIEGDAIEVTGVSKGKGNQGVVKRHHFSGGPASHGHRHVLRRPGSIGGRFPQHVMKGMRMAGRMGADQVTVKNLQVVKVDAEHNLVAVKGAVPGPKGSIVEIRSIETK
ncbi:MAG TPA: 50S ribosomal protein L3 [Candidatus Andersenbacteria bacterium]|nr:50S ribosomal protein L3 [Candidatus Andersenbacteria bacterium]